jgi:hypothetical protein
MFFFFFFCCHLARSLPTLIVGVIQPAGVNVRAGSGFIQQARAFAGLGDYLVQLGSGFY